MAEGAEPSNITEAPSRGLLPNTGNGAALQVVDIGHDTYTAVVAPDTAFWSLVRRDQLADVFSENNVLHQQYQEKAETFMQEMDALRFGLQPSAVYLNPTERCNLNCPYCYIPEQLRRDGEHMTYAALEQALTKLKSYFDTIMPEGRRPQIVFHGAEPLLNRDAVFKAIEQFGSEFSFGVQTNGTLLDDEAVEFLTSYEVGIGLSLDAATANESDKTRARWDGAGVHDDVLAALERLRGYSRYNVICTVTNQNLDQLVPIVEFFHEREVPVCMLNMVRCTLEGARSFKPDDAAAANSFIQALERSYELYQETGRKLIVANFANIILSIIAPTARRLMCDISPCGGGRSFFALAPDGGLFPCSEFIGLDEFRGGNLFEDSLPQVLQRDAFRKVTGRKVEDIEPCNRCALRHFCGSPCPAEAYEMHGTMRSTGGFCEFYERQARYALRLIAEGREEAFLWDGWDTDTKTTINLGAT